MKLLRTYQQMAAIAGVLITAAPAAMATVPERTAAPSHQGISSAESPGSLRAELELPRTAASPASSFAGRPKGALPDTAAARIADAPTAAEQRLAGSVQIAWPRPPLVAAVENSRAHGSPTVQLWENSHSLLTIGLNRHGIPGIYMFHKVP